jgi:hypothetical protein
MARCVSFTTGDARIVTWTTRKSARVLDAGGPGCRAHCPQPDRPPAPASQGAPACEHLASKVRAAWPKSKPPVTVARSTVLIARKVRLSRVFIGSLLLLSVGRAKSNPSLTRDGRLMVYATSRGSTDGSSDLVLVERTCQ